MNFEEIRQTVTIDAKPDEVYDAYLDPKRHSEFTGSPASGTTRVGGKFTAWDGYSWGRFLVLEKGKRIVHEWQTTEWPKGYPPSLVELTFKPARGKTALTMLHTKVPAEQAEEYAQGWREYYWEPLKRYFKRRG